MKGVQQFSVLLLSIMSLLGCSSSDSEEPKVPASSSGHVLLGRVENATVSVFSPGDNFTQARCVVKSASDDSVFARSGTVSVPHSCVDTSAEYHLLKISGGDDIDIDNDGQRDAVPSEVLGEFHAILPTQDLLAGNWVLSAVTETVYRNFVTALESQIAGDLVLEKLDEITRHLTAQKLSDYSQLLAITPSDWSLLAEAGEAYQGITQTIRDGGAGIEVLTSQLASPFFSLLSTAGSGQTDTKSLYLKNNTLYLADGSRGLVIFDVTDPSVPVMMSNFDPKDDHGSHLWEHSDLVVATDSHALLGIGANGIAVIDVSDPTRPNLVDTIDDISESLRLAVHNQYLYVSTGVEVRIYDISDPSNVSYELSITHPIALGFRNGMGIIGDKLYAKSASYNESVRVYDFSNDLSPAFLTTLPTSGHEDSGTCNIVGNYVVTSGVTFINSNVYVYDSLTEEHYKSNTTLTYAADDIVSLELKHIALIDDVFYWPNDDAGYGRLKLFDDLSITALPNIAVQSSLELTNRAYDLVANDSILYVATELGLEIYQPQAAKNPKLVQQLDLTGSLALQSIASDDYMAVVEWGSIELFDRIAAAEQGLSQTLSQPGVPLDSGYGRGAIIVDNILYSVGNNGLGVYDLNQTPVALEVGLPSNLSGTPYVFKGTDSEDLYGGVRPIFRTFTKAGNSLFLYLYQTLIEFNLDNPLVPEPVYAITSASKCTALGLINCGTPTGELAYGIVSNSSRLFLREESSVVYIDLSDASRTLHATALGSVNSLFATDNYLYVAVNQELRVYDANTLALLDSEAFTEEVNSVRLIGSTLYVMSDSTTYRYNASMPLELVESIETTSPYDVEERDGYLYISDGFNGLTVAKLKEIELP